MGGCMSRLKKEMRAPPPVSGNWDGFAPQRPETHISKEERVRQAKKQDEGQGAPLRRETESGIPGLTYDQAGRPVWREENSAEVDHREYKY